MLEFTCSIQQRRNYKICFGGGDGNKSKGHNICRGRNVICSNGAKVLSKIGDREQEKALQGRLETGMISVPLQSCIGSVMN
jgi:hypothetical protein